MTEADLAGIEASVGFPLPSAFRATVLSYPFAPDSFADEFMLPNRPSALIDLNGAREAIAGVSRPFFVGSDGGEESYFVDASRSDSPVYVFELETGRHRILVPSWAEYLGRIGETHAEIESDQALLSKRKLERRWWEFWK